MRPCCPIWSVYHHSSWWENHTSYSKQPYPSPLGHLHEMLVATQLSKTLTGMQIWAVLSIPCSLFLCVSVFTVVLAFYSWTRRHRMKPALGPYQIWEGIYIVLLCGCDVWAGGSSACALFWIGRVSPVLLVWWLHASLSFSRVLYALPSPRVVIYLFLSLVFLQVTKGETLT